ncbi:MAG: glyoxylase-like metal-dependent hydrolase (beta-lactamase superfamily II) [Bradymonadia bacterium]
MTAVVWLDSANAVTQRTRQLTDDLWRIRLDSACGLVVNVFLLRSKSAVALIDTGFPHTTEQLESALSELGLRVSDVTDVLYTHTHIDHIGGGVALADSWSPREWFWEGTEPAFSDVYAYLESVRSKPEWPVGFLPEACASDPLICEMHAKPRTPTRAGGTGLLVDPRGVSHGESVELGDYRFECVDGRGHDPFHCAWFCRRLGWLFSGDVIMAVPTPLVLGMGDEVGLWLGTLDRWESELDVTWLIPGHGMPTKLFQPSIARSRRSLVRLYDELSRQLNTGAPVEPLGVTRGVLPADRSRFSARSAVLLANVETLLSALEAEGVVEEIGEGRWLLRTRLPSLDAIGQR